ncbi:MAG TPA: hypothetical protein VM032_09840 [Vicinamibacterales bacterium]|nr:hypothetical protein [Vicinamibacterales bacterium]
MRNAEAVHDLETDLRRIFTTRMQSLVIYGGADAHDGPVATLAVVESVNATDLRHCAERVPLWHGRGLGTPLILEADEFGRSLDAFPFEFGAILADHEVVWGRNPFAGLAVDAADLRRACEVQARSHLLHLREGFMETEGRNDRLAELVVRSAAPLAALLKNMARLSGAPPASEALLRVAELAANGTISSDEARRLFPAYLEAVDELAGQLDRWSAA